MALLNKVFLMGNLTRDVDLRTMPGGNTVCDFGLAVSRKFITNGRQQTEVCFVNISVWGKTAEICKQNLSKGSRVFVEGRLRFEQWESRTGGGTRSKLSVVAENVQFIDTDKYDDGAGSGLQSLGSLLKESGVINDD
jgi:single-strand DNA-binding protein